MQTNNLCEIELFEIELFDHLSACKKMSSTGECLPYVSNRTI